MCGLCMLGSGMQRAGACTCGKAKNSSLLQRGGDPSHRAELRLLGGSGGGWRSPGSPAQGSSFQVEAKVRMWFPTLEAPEDMHPAACVLDLEISAGLVRRWGGGARCGISVLPIAPGSPCLLPPQHPSPLPCPLPTTPSHVAGAAAQLSTWPAEPWGSVCLMANKRLRAPGAPVSCWIRA